jgi:hypothetical protein
MLAQLTKERVHAIIPESSTNPRESQKVNRYLTSALRELNITIDVLLEQYNPSMKIHVFNLFPLPL